MSHKKRSYRVFVLVAAGVLGVAADAYAIVGRPLTPVSFAGVARRSVRRSAYVGAGVAAGAAYGAGAYGAYGAYGAPVATPTLPAGCVPYAPCGGTTVYAPVYNGPEVVYVPR